MAAGKSPEPQDRPASGRVSAGLNRQIRTYQNPLCYAALRRWHVFAVVEAFVTMALRCITLPGDPTSSPPGF
jgi:hypothetical protein